MSGLFIFKPHYRGIGDGKYQFTMDDKCESSFYELGTKFTFVINQIRRTFGIVGIDKRTVKAVILVEPKMRSYGLRSPDTSKFVGMQKSGKKAGRKQGATKHILSSEQIKNIKEDYEMYKNQYGTVTKLAKRYNLPFYVIKKAINAEST